ncbi:MAG: hypothetical protein ACK44Z_09100, partial [Pirellulaceae bacterium]
TAPVANAARRWWATHVTDSNRPPSGGGGYRKRANRICLPMRFFVANSPRSQRRQAVVGYASHRFQSSTIWRWWLRRKKISR